MKLAGSVLLVLLVLSGTQAGARGIDKRTVMVPMSDGAKLATDVYVPEGKGPFPTILWRTPYGRTRGTPQGWLARGYAVVKQDMRGRFDSEGENLPFVGCGWGKHRDGVETVAWIRKQKWSNGKVGTAGGSALGITQNLLAGAAPEGLVCQHVNVAAASLYHHAVYVGGAFRKSQVEKWLARNRFDPEALRLYRRHPEYDDFWRQFDSLTRLEEMTVPAMHVGGWFDTFALGTVEAFVGRQTRAELGSRGNQVLVMGPWAHGGFRKGGKVGELTFPNAKMPRAYSAQLWFDHHLMGKANEVLDQLPVAYYVMGDTEDPKAPGNEWRFAEVWPVKSKETAFFLHEDRSLSTTEQKGPFARLAYVFDPADPCPTIGGCNLVLPKG
ncbi:MAG: CocE/NonD family hydrolase, partial [Planctomycetota bacterium]